MKERLLSILKQYWGYDGFREMQYEIISSVLSGHDTLALMPTGGGKSLTYQLPTMASDGVCIVITPLIALMKDQIDRLKERGISAVAIHSGVSRRKIDIALDNCVYGDVKFLYIAPERLGSELFRLRVQKMNVALIAVDEAHCISQWGYDFRPSYLRIAQLRALIPDVPILALTASATEEVAQDIMRHLDFKSKVVLRSSFSRPNLSYVVRKVVDKNEQIINILDSVPGSGIIYTRKRETAELVCAHLLEQGISASYYHAGLPGEERSIRQDEWVSGKVRVMVATNAFGMGIDKPDVRFVIHYTMSDSMESYYQEAGRAGRDGKRSFAVLLVQDKDYTRLESRIERSFPPLERIKNMYEKICSYLMIAIGDGKGSSYVFNLQEFCAKESCYYTDVLEVIELLEYNEYMTYVEESDNPARVIFCVSRDELYRYEMTPLADRVVRQMLRKYNGLFTEFRAIDEQAIALLCGASKLEVHDVLKDLWRRHIIRYVPANSSPMIYMNEERLPTANIYISPQTYNCRRDQMLDRFNRMIQYADNEKSCRSVILENYFGDMTAQPCGSCDVCLENKRRLKNYTPSEQVVNFLNYNGDCTVRELSRCIPSTKEQIVAAVQELLEIGVIRVLDSGNITLSADRVSR